MIISISRSVNVRRSGGGPDAMVNVAVGCCDGVAGGAGLVLDPVCMVVRSTLVDDGGGTSWLLPPSSA